MVTELLCWGKIMVDIWSKDKRSLVMRKIRGKNTRPEIAVRSLLHSLGYRFTVNGPKNRELPGKPDVVLPKYKTVVFVHGCFWHQHENCRFAYKPKSNKSFWNKKLRANIKRDRSNRKELESLGWKVIIVWECKIKDLIRHSKTPLSDSQH